MDNLEPQPSSSPSQPGAEELQAQVASLASLLNSVLILVLVLGGAIDLYLVRQVKLTRFELTNMRAYVSQASRNGPAINEFARRLYEYGKAHADFAPIVTKYDLKNATNVAPAASSAPAPIAPAKK